MRILSVYNLHRHGGGADTAAMRSTDVLRAAGHEVQDFTQSSSSLTGMRGSIQAALSGLYSPHVLRTFREQVQAFRPELVHAHEIYPLISPWIFRICRELGVATCLTCHDYRLSCPIATHFRADQLCYACGQGSAFNCWRYNCCESHFKSLAYASRTALARRANLFGPVNRFMTPSESAKQLLCKHGAIAPDKVLVVGNPIDLGMSEPPLYRKGDYVAYAGRFEPEKGFQVLWQAMQGTGIELRVAGTPPGQYAESEHVRFMGHLNSKQMHDFYLHARVVVVPSLWHETFGLVVAEALSCATPVIVSDLGALAEVAGPGGVTVAAHDVHSLRQSILDLWEDENRLRTLGEAGQKHVEKFSNAAYLDRLLAGYHLAISDRTV